MFNNRKAVRMFRNGYIIGCIRVLIPQGGGKVHHTAYMVVHLAKEYKTDDFVIWAAYDSTRFLKRKIPGWRNYQWAVMGLYLPPISKPLRGYVVEEDQEFGGTTLKRSSSVLLGALTDLPLF